MRSSNDSRDETKSELDREQIHAQEAIWSNEEKRNLTKIATNRSLRYPQSVSSNAEPDRSYLDPSSKDFDLSRWMSYQVRKFYNAAYTPRKTGVIFKNLSVQGSEPAVKVQQTVDSILTVPFRLSGVWSNSRSHKTILHDFNGFLKHGETLLVLGRPGAGCSTFLKSISADTASLMIDEAAQVHYDGIPQDVMKREFKGEILYNQETEKHFPHLTVSETLGFAAAARAPRRRIDGQTRQEYVDHVRNVVMAVFGLSHTANTKVGSEYVRGVSGGERKRVSIAEMALAGSPLCCWDNATRGLDSASSFDFVRALQMSSRIFKSTHLVALYQASQRIYDLFDKVILLYEGREIFYGLISRAKAFFEEMGWYCPPRQTTGDFLTSLTNPDERQAKPGFEDRVPRTAEEFESYWKNSCDFQQLASQISSQQKRQLAASNRTRKTFFQGHREQQAKFARPHSPYVVSVPMQVKICTVRAYQLIWNDKTSSVTLIGGQIAMSFIIGSLFYGTPIGTQSFFARSSVLFFSILLNSLITVTEINTLYFKRPIVEKHASYRFCHPFSEALASVVSDIPVKLISGFVFNTTLYFLGSLRPEPVPFFVFFLFTFMSVLCVSQIFRTIAAASRTHEQAFAASGVVLLSVVIYTGFVIPKPNMPTWFKWIYWINPLAYAYESLIVNEFHGREFPCSNVIPRYPGFENGSAPNFVCGEKGAIAGELNVNGDRYLDASYGYQYGHLWRNFGILCLFTASLLILYPLVTEINLTDDSTAESLVYRFGRVPKPIMDAIREEKSTKLVTSAEAQGPDISEKQGIVSPAQHDVFSWRDVSFDIQMEETTRRLLDGVSGWVRPGSLTALMGVSGAGKTTLLNVLAQRADFGVVTGQMLVNGTPLDASFQRKTGYVQQQDHHLHTSTVREALRFSALLRQPKSVAVKEKYDYVEEVISMLNMTEFAEAVVGMPGEGLNVEQRKLLTIGVELAAKPALLLFLDEPTSGLDSQSSWTIVAFLRKLANHGQAILSTIHQPSATFFQEFDRLLFLAQGGRTVYFGDIGENSRTLLDYFERQGSRKCQENENPAEYMIELAGTGVTKHSTQDWHEIWRESPEAMEVKAELDRLVEVGSQNETETTKSAPLEQYSEFAMPFRHQLLAVLVRVFQQYWRTPTYIYGKFFLGVSCALFVGFSFYNPGTALQGLQSMIFAIFMMSAGLSVIMQQIMPQFIFQRDLYEVRERPSKTYHWAAFMIANIAVELPYHLLLGILVFAGFTYPVFGIISGENQVVILLVIIQFFLFGSTFAHAVVATLPDAETAAEIATLIFYVTLIFNGVLVPREFLPGFWKFMYRVSPMTYIVNTIAAAGVGGRRVECSNRELSVFQPPNGLTCGEYMQLYFWGAGSLGGYLVHPNATEDCQYCLLHETNQFLGILDIRADDRWFNFGIVWIYICFNVFFAVLVYYLFRVKRWKLKH